MSINSLAKLVEYLIKSSVETSIGTGQKGKALRKRQEMDSPGQTGCQKRLKQCVSWRHYSSPLTEEIRMEYVRMERVSTRSNL